MKRLITFCSALVLGLFVLLAPVAARADVNNFLINDFTADYYLTRDTKQGELRIVERIDLTFTDNNHGIIRAIPARYKDKTLNLTIISVSSETGAPSEYGTYTENNNTVIKIGNPNRTVTGKQVYNIEYKVSGVISFYDGNDELYWDVNGDQWLQSFTKVTARLHLPTGLEATDAKCFTGTFGSKEQACEVTATQGGTSITTTRPLAAKQTLSFVVALSKGYFVAPTFKDLLPGMLGLAVIILLPPLLIGGWAYRKWAKNGKDLKGRGTIIPEYQPPAGLSAAEMATVVSYKLDTKHISATVIDLAISKYLRVIEVTEKKLLKGQKTYEFELLVADWTRLKPHERKIMEGIFTGQPVGGRVVIDSLKNKFHATATTIQEELPATLTAAGYFTSNPLKSGNSMYLIGGALLAISFLLVSLYTVGLGISGLLIILFGYLMPKRTELGTTTKEHAEGLKLYMETAEKDRITMLQSADARYAATSPEPVKTVELFEKLLPYAMVLGVESSWAKQFEDIYRVPPDWYSGNWQTFSAVYFASSLNNSVSAMATNFSPPSSSGSSGFSSGGGFSGGGGGGGGGGGW